MSEKTEPTIFEALEMAAYVDSLSPYDAYFLPGSVTRPAALKLDKLLAPHKHRLGQLKSLEEITKLILAAESLVEEDPARPGPDTAG